MASVFEDLGLTQQHFENIDAMKKDPSAFGIGNQMDYAIESGRDLVSQSKNPITSTIGQTIASPVYDYGQALQKYSDKGYRGEWGLTPQGIMDFAKNVGYVGQVFLDQQPITMMTGRGIGGLKELFGYNDADEKGTTGVPEGTMKPGGFQENVSDHLSCNHMIGNLVINGKQQKMKMKIQEEEIGLEI